jgi:hypothetical protein
MIARAFGLAALFVLHSNIKCRQLIAEVILFLIQSVLSRKDVIPTLRHFLGVKISRFQDFKKKREWTREVICTMSRKDVPLYFIGHFWGLRFQDFKKKSEVDTSSDKDFAQEGCSYIRTLGGQDFKITRKK